MSLGNSAVSLFGQVQANEIGFGSSQNVFTSSPDVTWDDTLKLFVVNGTINGRDIAADGIDIDLNTTHRNTVSGNPHNVISSDLGIGVGFNEVAFGGAFSTVTSNSDFTFDPTTKALTLQTTSGVSTLFLGDSTTGNLTIVGQDANPNFAGSNNTTVGRSAGLALIAGSSGNVLIGRNAGTGLTDGFGNNCIGNFTMGGAGSTGNSNIVIGYFVQAFTALTGDNNTIIENSFLEAPSGSVSNYLSLRGTIFADTSSDFVRIGGSGVVAGPETLRVEGDIKVTTGNFLTSIDEIYIGPDIPTGQGVDSIGIGQNTATTNQGAFSVAIGTNTATNTQGQSCVAIGNSAGGLQSNDSIAIGRNAGLTSQGGDAIAIGENAGRNQGSRSIAIGRSCGITDQDLDCIAIGQQAGETRQIRDAIAIGRLAGATDQGSDSVSLGVHCGEFNQGNRCVAIGDTAGETNQGTASIAIGRQAGRNNQGANGMIFSTEIVPVEETTVGHIIFESTLARLSFTSADEWSFIGGSVAVGVSSADDSSILELLSTTKGFLQSRMTTTQRNAISTPATSLQVYNTTSNTMDLYDGVAWRQLAINSSSVVMVRTMADFPAPAAGVITLEANKMYVILESLVTSDRFVPAPNSTNVIMGAVTGVTSLTYLGTAAFFTTPDLGLLIFRNIIVAAASTGTIIDVTGLTSSRPVVAAEATIFAGFTSGFGTMDSAILAIDLCSIRDIGNLTLTNAPRITVTGSTFQNTSGDLGTDFFTIDGTADVIGNISDCTFVTNANEDVFDIDSAIGADSLIRITNNSFTGAGKALDSASIDTKDLRLESNQNRGLRPSRIIGSMISQGNAVETVITTQGVGISNYVDFNLGQANGAITVFADNGSGGTTVTSAAHGQPNERLVGIADTTSYNGNHEIFAVTANTYDIDVAFVADDATGTWVTGGFPDIDIERWELNNAANGELKYIGRESFSCLLIATISALAVGGSARRYKFRALVNGVDGFAIPNDIKSDVTETTLKKGVDLVTGDLVKLQVANFEGTQNIIIDTVSLGIG